MSRAFQLAGSASGSSVSRQMDVAFSWDADRDANKQVALKTSWTSGEKNKADVTVSLPSINQVRGEGRKRRRMLVVMVMMIMMITATRTMITISC
jgi:hypothetical protein